MHASDLISRHPRLFHTADARAWDSIQEWGLLPTSMLAQGCGAEFEGPRRQSAVLAGPDGRTVVIRDQLPLKFLDRVLEDDTTVGEFLDILDSRVFFWATEARLQRLLQARMYRSTPQVVLTVDTHSLVSTYGHLIELSPYNSGSAHVPTAPKRGRSTFKPITDYDYEGWQRARGRSGEALVEVTVPAPIPDVLKYVLDVQRFPPGDAG